MIKDNRQRLFEVMGKVNPDFILKEADFVQGLVNKATGATIKKSNINQNAPIDPNNPNYRLETYGDLKKAVNVIKTAAVGSKLGGVAVSVVTSILTLGLANVAQTAIGSSLDLFKAFYNRPDSKKTGTWLDKLDVDDNFSKIVDDNVEDAFLKFISDVINREPDDKPLEPNFNMNQKLIEYLSQHYGNRTLTGAPLTT